MSFSDSRIRLDRGLISPLIRLSIQGVQQLRLLAAAGVALQGLEEGVWE